MILLARHGETDDNREPIRIQGSRDTPLNATGRAQAHELAERVAAEAVPVAVIHCSQLSRARETAEIVGGRVGLEPIVDSRLAEGDRGDLEGRLLGGRGPRRPGGLRRLAGGGVVVPLPRRRVAARAAGARGRRAGATSRQAGKLPALVVCHGGSIRVALCTRTRAAWRSSTTGTCPTWRWSGCDPSGPHRVRALVLATFGAFFVAQRLKQSPRVARALTITTAFSPNGNGVLDRARIRFELNRSDDVTISLVDADGETVRRLVDNQRVSAGRPVEFFWDGRTGEGAVAPDGTYRVRVTLRREGRSVFFAKAIRLDTTPPRPVVFVTGPAPADTRPVSRRAARRARALPVRRADAPGHPCLRLPDR